MHGTVYTYIDTAIQITIYGLCKWSEMLHIVVMIEDNLSKREALGKLRTQQEERTCKCIPFPAHSLTCFESPL